MPPFTLRWANRSTSRQDWIIHNFDHFTLAPDFVRTANININNDRTFNIAANTSNTFAAANLTYSAGGNTWALNSLTPHEWQLATGNGIVTVRCLLDEAAHAQAEEVLYKAHKATADPESASGRKK